VQSFRDAYQRYLAGLSQDQRDARSAYEGILRDYSDAMRAAGESGDWARAYEAYLVYMRDVAKASANLGGPRRGEAYRGYVRALKEVWARVDPEAITPEQLGELANGLAAVVAGSYAGGVGMPAERVPGA
jgi:hypothetical protein